MSRNFPHRGGGIVIYSNKQESFILTAQHILGATDMVFVDTHDKRYPVGKVLWRHSDPKIDLAIVSAPIYLPAVSLASCGQAMKGEPVFAVGHPGGDLWSSTKGIVKGFFNSILSEDKDITPANAAGRSSKIYADTYTLGGSSGGGLFAEQGPLVGIISQKVTLFNTPIGALAEPIFNHLEEINKVLPEAIHCTGH